MPINWQSIRRELNESGKTLWLRDDDAIQPTPQLERLLALCNRHGIPLMLAVIPGATHPLLAEHIGSEHSVTVAAHGYAHTNYALENEKKSEYPASRLENEVATELKTSFTIIKQLFGDQFTDCFVPPWNRIDSKHLQSISSAGFTAMSGFAKPLHTADNPTHLDILSWHPKPARYAGTHEINERLVNLLATPTVSIGFLSHHQVHDEPTWAFLEELFTNLPARYWRSFPAIEPTGLRGK